MDGTKAKGFFQVSTSQGIEVKHHFWEGQYTDARARWSRREGSMRSYVGRALLRDNSHPLLTQEYSSLRSGCCHAVVTTEKLSHSAHGCLLLSRTSLVGGGWPSFPQGASVVRVTLPSQPRVTEPQKVRCSRDGSLRCPGPEVTFPSPCSPQHWLLQVPRPSPSAGKTGRCWGAQGYWQNSVSAITLYLEHV